ncbi:DUF4148 domain-containing protein [Bordetella bronchialis]|uniref:DUF4148 domain-containing protein n=1 Tax=Bordetella bronchialis TaxID=463025 RepID=A0A193FQF4_9BORD|nr:DUF4148 domain-containing protein [Bordetella bronchialis]ANN64953.1 hypothetical protein BAU06_00260 [Bordetella bronchialis]ANN69982.1 hypothetical protein BAU08_00250 [Bordetella bronchialis]
MKAKTIVSAVILSFAAIGAAQAANSEPNNVPFQGVYGQTADSVSRAQVVADLQQARAAGLTGNADTNNAPFTAQADSGVSRAQIALGSDFGDSNNEPFQGA